MGATSSSSSNRFCSFEDPDESAVVLNSCQEGVEEFPLELHDLILRQATTNGLCCFASSDSGGKVHIVQRGAVRPLIDMLRSADFQLREMSAFALGRLPQVHERRAIFPMRCYSQFCVIILDQATVPVSNSPCLVLVVAGEACLGQKRRR